MMNLRCSISACCALTNALSKAGESGNESVANMAKVYAIMGAVNSPQGHYLCGFLRFPGALRAAPVNAFEEHGKLGAGQVN